MVVLVIRAEEEDATRKENLRLRPYKRQQQRSEKMRFYHAAPKETMMKIYAEGKATGKVEERRRWEQKEAVATTT